MIEMGKTYRTYAGREVRVLCTDGPNEEYPVVALVEGDIRLYSADGLASIRMDKYDISQHEINSLVEADPHGILPRHRELLAEAMAEHKHDFCENVEIVRTGTFASLVPAQQVALIALARLDRERGE